MGVYTSKSYWNHFDCLFDINTHWTHIDWLLAKGSIDSHEAWIFPLYKEFMMTLLNLFILIILAGIALGIINAYIPMAPMIKSLLNILVFVLLLIYVLQFFGIITMILPYPMMFHGVKGA